MGRKQRDKAKDAVAIGRIAVGAGAWLTPNLSGRLFGLDPEGNPQLPYIGRLFGARDVVLGAGVLRSSRKQKDAWADGRDGLRRRRRRRPARSPARAGSSARGRRWSRRRPPAFACAGCWLLQQVRTGSALGSSATGMPSVRMAGRSADAQLRTSTTP